MTNPKISIVVPSFNQGECLAETLQSLANQDCRPLEVIIQDAGSRDESIQIAQNFAQKFPNVFQLRVEKDRGRSHRLCLGFEKVTGEILGFLNAGDTLFPGCLRRVAEEICPERERYIVMGRTVFTGAGVRYTGIEHPCEFIDHFHHLAIWKRGLHTIPQPSVFWHRVVWEKCGGFDEDEQALLDYELFIRFSKYYRFYRIDELWSTYCVHSEFGMLSLSETEFLNLSIATSRKHWGPWWSLLRWRCELSFWLHNPRTFEKARHHARLAEDAFLRKAGPRTLMHAAATFLHSPKLAWDRLAAQYLLYRLFPIAEALLLRPKARPEETAPRYGDAWIGPNFAEKIQIPDRANSLVLRLQFFRPRPVITKIVFVIDGKKARTLTRRRSGILDVNLGVKKYQGTTVTLEIRCSSSFTPSEYTDENDHRRLSLRIRDLRFR
ncbi:MAG TPA: glycosyltransferase [Chthoniobacterales bacterium]|nr:glycosyltransferase [Chthoniobacterales bacterium]